MRSTAFILLTLVAFFGCSSDPTSESLPAATNPDVGQTIESDSATSTSEVHVIDVRSKDEWDSGHVEQAVHIPHTEIAERISEVTTDKDAKIVLYCAVGGRAGQAKDTLEELGYTNVENGGGFDDVKGRFE